MIEAKAMTVIDEMEPLLATRRDAWNIPREEGMLLHTLAMLGGFVNMVEVGTSYGFSGLFLGAAARANGGVLHTFEKDARKCEMATQSFLAAGLDGAVRVEGGDAVVNLANLKAAVDFAFLDAAKEQTGEYWRVLEPRLARRCTIAIDNVTTHPKQLGPFVDMLRGRGDFTCCTVTVGNGFELAVRRA